MSQAKRFGGIKPAADTWTLLYEVPDGFYIQYEIHIANVSTSTSDVVAFAVTTAATPTDADIIIPADNLNKGAHMQLTQKGAQAGDRLMVKATSGFCAFSASGFEANIPAAT